MPIIYILYAILLKFTVHGNSLIHSQKYTQRFFFFSNMFFILFYEGILTKIQLVKRGNIYFMKIYHFQFLLISSVFVSWQKEQKMFVQALLERQIY